MAYEIKGDVTVAKTLTAELSKAKGYDTITTTVTGVTATAFVVDMANGVRDVTLLVDNTSTGDLTVSAPSNVAAGVTKVSITLSNGDTISRNYVFAAAYKNAGNQNYGTLTVGAGETRILSGRYTGTNWIITTDTAKLPVGSLAKRGVVTSDADVGEGIYMLDSSGGAFNFTLPAATGTQERRIFDVSDASNPITLKVQTGETMNAKINGAYTFTKLGEMVQAVDRSTGFWDVAVLGTAASNPLHSASLAASLNSFSGVDTVVSFDTVNDNTGGIATNATTITIAQDGKYEVSFTASGDMDEATSAVREFYVVKNNPTVGTAVAAQLSDILHSQSFANSTDAGIVSWAANGIFDLIAGDTLVLYFEGASATDAIRNATFSVKQLPSSEVVFAGMVEPTALGRVSGYRTTTVNIGNGNPLPMEVVTVSENITETMTTNGLVLLKAGKVYDIKAGVRLETGASGYGLWYVRTTGGTNISGRMSLESTNANTNNATLSSTSLVYKPLADEYIALYIDPSSTLGEAGIGTYLTVNELPSTTVVDPSFITPKTLSRIQVSLTAVANISGGGPTPWDEILHQSGPDLGILGTGVITGLKAGNTYKIESIITHPGLASGVMDIQFRDVTNNQPLGEVFTTASNNDVGAQDSPNYGKIIITPNTDISVALEYVSGAIGDVGVTSWMSVEQLSESTVVRPEDAKVTTALMAKMTNSAAQALAGGSTTALVYNAVAFDTGSSANAAAGTFTVPNAGVYEVTCNADVDNSINSASYTVQIKVGTTVVASQKYSSTNAQAGSGFNLSTGPINLSASDIVTAEYTTNEANGRTTQNGAPVNWLSIKQLSANVVK